MRFKISVVAFEKQMIMLNNRNCDCRIDKVIVIQIAKWVSNHNRNQLHLLCNQLIPVLIISLNKNKNIKIKNFNPTAIS